jgi:hypothetical protein
MTTRKIHPRPRSGRYPFTIDEGDEDAGAGGDVIVLDQTVIRGGRGDADDDDDKSSILLVVVGEDDDDQDQAAVWDDADEAVLFEEATMARLPASTTTGDMEGDRLRAMEDVRLDAAEVRRRAAEDRLAELRRRHGTRTKTTLAQHLANLPLRQWWACLVILGVIFALAIVTIGLCEAPAGHVWCGRRS